jgi:hypothetical protein
MSLINLILEAFALLYRVGYYSFLAVMAFNSVRA